MTVETVALTDGGRVEWWVAEDPESARDSVIHVQKFDAAGDAVGGEYTTTLDPNYHHVVLAMSDGGFVVGVSTPTMDGMTLSGAVFRADGGVAATLFGGSSWQMAASPDGGFVVGSVSTVHHGFTVPDSRIALYDNEGAVVTTAQVSSSTGPAATVDAEGVYHVTWTDRGGNAHELLIDPDNPPSFTPPAAPTGISWLDDVGTDTGVLSAGGGTDDASPIIRVPVTETGYVAVEVVYAPGFGGNAPTNPSTFVPVTDADVARGYAEISFSSPFGDNNYKVAARFESDDGVVGPQYWVPIRVDTHSEASVTWVKGTDDAGPEQGDFGTGSTTDDTTPSMQISLADTGAQPYDKLLVFDNGQQSNIFVLDAETVARGYVTWTPTLGQGDHTLTAQIVDFAGNRGTTWNNFQLTVGSEDDAVPTFSTTPDGTPTSGLGDFQMQEKYLPNGTEPDAAQVIRTGSVYFHSAEGVDDLTVGGQTVIQDGVLVDNELDVTGGRLTFAYDAAAARLDYTYNFEHAVTNQPNAARPYMQSLETVSQVVLTDADGDTATGHFSFRISDDGLRAVDDANTVALGSGPVWGNVLDNDAGADGAHFLSPVGSQETDRGVLTFNSDGSYSYALKAGATAGVDQFTYSARSADGEFATHTATLSIEVTGGSSPPDDGTSGGDTIHAPQSGGTITTGEGSDVIVWDAEPWSPSEITDFQLGVDRIDFSAVLQASGYVGSDPVRDGYVSFLDDGAGGTKVLFDRDASGADPQWPNYVMHLEGVSSTGLTWADLTGDSEPPPPQGSIQFDNGGAELRETDDAVTTFNFFVLRSGDTSGAATVDWTVAGYGPYPADAADFQGGVLPSGRLTFAAGETSKTIAIQVAPDEVDELDEQFSVTLAGAAGASLGAKTIAVGTVADDDDPDQPPVAGERIVSDQYGDTLQGGAGNDTLVAGQGPDQLTGAGGGDVFAFDQLPWNAGHVTDFAVGADRLDLSGLGAGQVQLHDDGASTQVFFDPDDPNAGEWPWLITTLDGVSGASWTQLSTGGGPEEPPPPPPEEDEGQVLTSDQYGDVLVGGAGADTLNAGQGPDQLTGAGGADHFVFQALPWNAGHVTDFELGVDKLDLHALHEAHPGGLVSLQTDGAGGTRVYVDIDGADNGDWPYLITTLDGVSPNQITANDWLW